MFAVIKLGSSQYKVSEGDTIDTQLLEGEVGESITLKEILLFSNGTDVRIGQPFVKNINITAEILDHHLDDKKISFKYSRRKNQSWKKGHRQKLVKLSIKKINL